MVSHVIFSAFAPGGPTAPTLWLAPASDTGVSNNDGVTNALPLSLSGTKDAGASVTVHDTDGTPLATVPADGLETWSVTLPPIMGSHSLYATSEDGGGGLSASSDILQVTVDTAAPTMTIVSSKSSLGAGQTAIITFTFSEPPAGTFTEQDVVFSGGTLSNFMGIGTVYSAEFTPTPDTTSGTASITVPAGSYTDAAGNSGGAGASPTITFSTVRPALSSVTLSDSALAVGETATVTFAFTEAVTGFDLGDITVPNGALGPLATSDGGVTWTATLTPTTGVADASNSIIVDLSGVMNGAGNAGVGTMASPNYAVSTTQPSLAAPILISDASLTAGETATVTFTFTEAVTGFDLGDITVPNGALSNLTSDDGITWTATLTPEPGVTDDSNAIIVDLSGVMNEAGNAGVGTRASLNYTVSTTQPSLAGPIAISDTALRIGDSATVTMVFTEAVIGFDLGDITAPNASLSDLASADGGVTWTVTLTPDLGVADGSNILTLDYSGLVNLAGNVGTGSATSFNYAVDTTRPALATGIAISDTVLAAGESATVTFTFTEAVSGFTTSDITAPNATLSGLSSSDGGVTWTVTLIPDTGVNDSTNTLTLDYSGIADLAGNAGTGSVESPNYAVVTATPPTVGITLSDTALRYGETATVTFTFSEPVTGFSLGSITAPNGTISNLTTSDATTFTATFTPMGSIEDASNVVTVDLTGLVNGDNVSGVGVASSANFEIDTRRPTAIIDISKTSLASGDTANVTFTFSEAVVGFDLTDVNAPNGTLSGLSSTDGGRTWTATFTPGAGVYDATNVLSLQLAGVADAAGNVGAGTVASATYAVDTRPAPQPEPEPPPPAPAPPSPVISAGVQIVTSPDGNSSFIGSDSSDLIDLTNAPLIATPGLPVFTETGAPGLPIGLGGHTVVAGAGSDSIFAGAGHDLLHGGSGMDTIYGGGGRDAVRGGQGDDFVHGNTGDDLLFGDRGQDIIHGGQGFDMIYGGDGSDILLGDLGEDTLDGGEGDDTMLGGVGDDVLWGAEGDDVLVGGLGADTFRAAARSGQDLITDFNYAEGDRLQIEPGTGFTVSQAATHVIVDFHGGGRVIIQDTNLADLPEGWII